MSLPSFFNVTPPGPTSSGAPASPPWLSVTVPIASPVENAAAIKARILAQFETVFPRILAQVYAGYTVSRAVSELPVHAGFTIDYGMFNRWVRKDPTRRAQLEEAEEARAEVWADRIIEHAEGVGAAAETTIERSKFACDQYKFLMGRQSRKRYGETKVIDVTHTISISAALEQSRQRVIEAVVVDDYLPEDEDEVRVLIAQAEDSEDGDEG